MWPLCVTRIPYNIVVAGWVVRTSLEREREGGRKGKRKKEKDKETKEKRTRRETEWDDTKQLSPQYVLASEVTWLHFRRILLVKQ